MQPDREEQIDRALRRSIDADHLDPRDPWSQAQFEIMRRMCRAYEDAMRLADIPPETQRQVLNIVLFGHPEGIEDLRRKQHEEWASVILKTPITGINFDWRN